MRNQTEVPGEVILQTYLETTVVTRGDLLRHPRFPRAGLARLADSPNWQARALVALDPDAPATLIGLLSHDDHPGVRRWMAGDRRLSLDRLRELFDDADTAEPAAANPRLPRDLMERILADAATLATG